jgi:uncharacterized protein YhbP (UPF0306 family)
MMERDPGAVAREIIEANSYMVLATADADGVPWISPVWFAHDRDREFLWISRPERRHSQNIGRRPDIAISIFDSTQRLGTGHGVAMSARAAVLEGADLVRAVEIVGRRSVEHGGGMFTVDAFAGDASLRLYRALAVEQFVVLGDDNRRPIEL